MARRKVKKRSVRRRASFRAKAPTRRRKKSSMNKDLMEFGGAVGYSMARTQISSRLGGFANQFNIPVVGQVGDEMLMLGLTYLAKKGKIPVIGKFPIVKAMGRAGFIIESALVGQQLASKFMNRTPTATPSQTSTQTVFA